MNTSNSNWGMNIPISFLEPNNTYIKLPFLMNSQAHTSETHF